MITNYFTLQALGRELHHALLGTTVREVFSQDKNQLTIAFSDALRVGPATDQPVLNISVDSKLCYMVLRDRASRARKNSVDLFHGLVDSTVEEISMHSYDRTVIVKFVGGLSLHLRLYGTLASNVLLVGEQDIVREAFKNNKELEGTHIEQYTQRFDPTILSDPRGFSEAMQTDARRTVLAAMKQTFPIFGTIFIRETLYRSQVEETTSIRDVPVEAFPRIPQNIQTILQELRQPSPRIYHDVHGKDILSIVPLDHLKSFETEVFQSVNAAVQRRIIDAMCEERLADDKEGLLGKIRKELDRAERGREKSIVREKEGKDSEHFERTGKLLLVNLTEIRKGMKQVMLEDPYSKTLPVQVQLDPTLTPVQNAERYFEKAKKSKLASEEFAKRLKDLERTIARLKTMEEALASCETTEEIKEFHKKFDEGLRAMKIVRGIPGGDQLPFRIFTVAGEFEVWVGKSSANNDLLTMKYAKPNDLWFHVRGASGSHTVLKVRNATQLPPKEAILQAASIAAYYSKMRNAGSVPVAYCARKYVKKPKGANQGAVMLEREKVIFVKPRLP